MSNINPANASPQFTFNAQRFLNAVGRADRSPDTAANVPLFSNTATWLGNGQVSRLELGSHQEALAQAATNLTRLLDVLGGFSWLEDSALQPVQNAVATIERETQQLQVVQDNFDAIAGLDSLFDQVTNTEASQADERETPPPTNSAETVSQRDLDVLSRLDGDESTISNDDITMADWIQIIINGDFEGTPPPLPLPSLPEPPSVDELRSGLRSDFLEPDVPEVGEVASAQVAAAAESAAFRISMIFDDPEKTVSAINVAIWSANDCVRPETIEFSS